MQALVLASSQSWLPLLRPSIPIGWRLRQAIEVQYIILSIQYRGDVRCYRLLRGSCREIDVLRATEDYKAIHHTKCGYSTSSLVNWAVSNNSSARIIIVTYQMFCTVPWLNTITALTVESFFNLISAIFRSYYKHYGLRLADYVAYSAENGQTSDFKQRKVISIPTFGDSNTEITVLLMLSSTHIDKSSSSSSSQYQFTIHVQQHWQLHG